MYKPHPLFPTPEPAPPVFCPVCLRPLGEYDEVYTAGGSDHVAGCSRCLHAHSAPEWLYCAAEA